MKLGAEDHERLEAKITKRYRTHNQTFRCSDVRMTCFMYFLSEHDLTSLNVANSSAQFLVLKCLFNILEKFIFSRYVRFST